MLNAIATDGLGLEQITNLPQPADEKTIVPHHIHSLVADMGIEESPLQVVGGKLVIDPSRMFVERPYKIHYKEREFIAIKRGTGQVDTYIIR